MNGKLTYVVQIGDTVYSIAKKFDLEVEELLFFNKIKDPNSIYVGQVLYLTY